MGRRLWDGLSGTLRTGPPISVEWVLADTDGEHGRNLD